MTDPRPGPSAVLSAEQHAVLVASAPLGCVPRGGHGAGAATRAQAFGRLRLVHAQDVAPSQVLDDLKSLALPIHVRQNDEGTFLGQVGGVDYSVFRYPYPLVECPVSVERCPVASLRDIAAMKMTAIVQRATKRDYVDLHALFASRQVTLREAIETMHMKYPRIDPSLAVHALTFFRDVERDPMPPMLNRTSWEAVQRDLVRLLARDLGRGGPSR